MASFIDSVEQMCDGEILDTIVSGYRALNEGVSFANGGLLIDKIVNSIETDLYAHVSDIITSLVEKNEYRTSYRIPDPNYEAIQIILVSDPDNIRLSGLYSAFDRSIRINVHDELLDLMRKLNLDVRKIDAFRYTMMPLIRSELYHELSHHLDFRSYRFFTRPRKAVVKAINMINSDPTVARNYRYALAPTEITARVTLFMFKKIRDFIETGIPAKMDRADIDYIVGEMYGGSAPTKEKKSILRKAGQIIDSINHCGSTPYDTVKEILEKMAKYMPSNQFNANVPAYKRLIQPGVFRIGEAETKDIHTPTGRMTDEASKKNINLFGN